MTQQSQSETYATWNDVRERLATIRLSGYKATAVDMGATIVVRITLGKHSSFAYLPAPKEKQT